MPRFSRIENRTSICLSANRILVDEAKEKKLNLSLIFDQALKSLLNAEGESARIKAMEIRMDSLNEYVNKKGLKNDYDDYRWNDKEVKNVLEEKREFGEEGQLSVREALTRAENN